MTAANPSSTSPQPLQVRRRGGAKRGDHGSYVTPAATPVTPDRAPAATSLSGAISVNDTDTTAAPRRHRRSAAAVSDAQRAAGAAYDAKPKVTVRGVDEDVYYKLRAIYRHQLRSPDGIEGWSEFGRALLRDYVEGYERQHGEMTGGEAVKLPTGRRVGS